MAEIVNLNRARKARARAEKDAAAAENRIKFGRTKAEKQATKAEQDRARRTIDGHQLDKPDHRT